MLPAKTERDISVLAMQKGKERYIVIYRDRTALEAMRTLGQWASDSQLSFSWPDASLLAQRAVELNRNAGEQDDGRVTNA